VKIKTISLTDFRAFPGPAPTTFELDGKNLLVYGENGSGKSSLFHALRGLFSYNTPPNLLDMRNSFSGTGIGDVRVHVEFGDSTAVAWEVGAGELRGANALATKMFVGPIPVAVHPGHTAPVNVQVREAAKFSAMLDYRSLLNTNYKHGDGAINLFEPMVMELLAGFVDLATNKTILELWQAVQSKLPTINTPRSVGNALHSCTQLNAAMKRAITLLLPEAQAILRRLCPNGLQLVDLPFKGVRYNGAKALPDKAYVDKEIGLQVSFRNIEVDRPQNYLNEARLSALALALYLGARLACTPQTTSHLKLLVLDDVLVGLDHSNRLPVLNVLKDHFPDWQIVLLTHDRGWFDLAYAKVSGEQWCCYEIFEGDPSATAPRPVHRKIPMDPSLDRPARIYLSYANDMLALNYHEAAANYARQAMEATLRGGCEKQNVAIRFVRDPKKIKAQFLLDELKAWGGNAKVSKTKLEPILDRLNLLKDVVMNPYSHPSAPNIPKSEVQAAVTAVSELLALIG
jgi:energy-coupling factor transporter ATP-binding protein EcfA2